MFNISKKILKASEAAMIECRETFEKIEEIVQHNQQKVLKAFIENGVSDFHFSATTGYGYGDKGRETLNKVFSSAFDAEDALVSHSIVSGTHALSTALFGVLRPGDKILSITGLPYDTLIDVIGINSPSPGSLKEFLVDFEYINLLENSKPDLDLIEKKLSSIFYKAIYIQKSSGYTTRKAISVDTIKKLIPIIKKVSPKSIVLVDNCYGEFVEHFEPTKFGADLIAGSLIKNPGSGIAKSGGYLAGKKDLIDLAANRLFAPGIGSEIGPSLGFNQDLFLGFFMAPHTVGEALKSSVFISAIFELLGFQVFPKSNEKRADIVQAVKLNSRKSLIKFTQSLQKFLPVNSKLVPEPSPMPGYKDEIISACSGFVQGSSIELSSDAPLKDPFIIWIQGGTSFVSSKVSILLALSAFLSD